MSKVNVHPVPSQFAADAHVNREQYEAMYTQSLADPDTFWANQAKAFLSWEQDWHTVNEYDFRKGVERQPASAARSPDAGC